MNQRKETKALARTSSEAIEKAEKAMEMAQAIVEGCSVQALAAKPAMIRTIKTSAGVSELRHLLTDAIVADVFMPLMGTRLGFKTDRDDKPQNYSIETVREVAIEAMMRGFLLVGNEVNIIAGNAYFTKEGFERAVAEFPGVTDLDFKPGVPVQGKDSATALVPYHVDYRVGGRSLQFICDIVKVGDRELDLRIPVRVNSGMGIDAVLGKARRKVLARLHEKLSGVKTPEGDLDDHDVIEAEGHALPATGDDSKSQAEKLANRHKGGPRGAQQTIPDGGREREPGED